MRDHRARCLLVISVGVLLALPAPSTAQFADLANLTAEEQALVTEHAFGGLPGTERILVRQGYIASYDPSRRVPSWVAYHVTPDYRNMPRREGKFATFRTDPNVPNPTSTQEYVGLFASRGFARGHLAPHAVMGGDRDGDGQLAVDNDPFDEQTIFQANFMSNVAPQHHRAFNGSGGLWSNLERWVQDEVVVGHGFEVWVYAGAIFGPGTHETVGPDDDIHVPAMFYKIVVRQDPDLDEPLVLAFLFPHQRSSHGEIEDFLVTVDVLEALTGLDFFPNMDDNAEEALEDLDSWENWVTFLPTP